MAICGIAATRSIKKIFIYPDDYDEVLETMEREVRRNGEVFS